MQLPMAMEQPLDKTSFPPSTMEASTRSPGSFLSPLSEEQRCSQSLDDTSYESQDAWGEWPERSAGSTQGSPWRLQKPRSKLGESRSLPALRPATLPGTWYSHSPHANTWYSGENHSISSPTKTLWSPLGSTWREREKDGSVPIRKNVDDGSAFIHGCVPSWSKMNTRKVKSIEHELTWSYYRMCRHSLHPHREAVGDPHLPNDCVVQAMRSGDKFKFQFWRDLKPPFYVTAIRRDQEDAAIKHPDGDLFYVSYQCGLDYVSERLWNGNTEGGSFDNKIKGVASLRIPDGYPQQRGITIASWGSPSLNATEQVDPNGAPFGDGFIDPNKWMPISQELSQRPDLPRFGACREATRKAHANIKARRLPVKVAPLQKLLLGPHSSLPRLAATQGIDLSSGVASPPAGAYASSPGSGGGSTPSPKKKRQHRIFTAAAGFVRYEG